MASRAEHKQQARARRLADERARLERKRRQRRVYVLGGVALGAVAVVAVAIAVSGGGGGSTGLKNGNGRSDARRPGPAAARWDPAVGSDAGQPEGAGDVDLLQRPAMPDLRGVHAQKRLPGAGSQRRAGGQGEDRVPRLRDGDARSADVPGPAGRGARGRQAEPPLGLRRAVLPPARHRGHELCHRDVPQRARTAGPCR